jgi:hypothetical protein
MAHRLLNKPEHDLAKQVFRDTLPYGRIFIIDRLGLFGRPYPVNNVSLDGDGDAYHINVGPGLSGMQSPIALSKILIRELTHVWQSDTVTNGGTEKAKSACAMDGMGIAHIRAMDIDVWGSTPGVMGLRPSSRRATADRRR